MLIKNYPHRNLIEEKKDNTYLEGSLHSKMSTIKLDHDVLDMLRAKKDKEYINMTNWASAVLRKELMKETDSIRNYINNRADL